jgi:hypothetical protein
LLDILVVEGPVAEDVRVLPDKRNINRMFGGVVRWCWPRTAVFLAPNLRPPNGWMNRWRGANLAGARRW